MPGTVLSTFQVLNHIICLPISWGKDHHYSQFIDGKSWGPAKQCTHGHTASKWQNQRSGPDSRFQSLCSAQYPTSSQQGWKELAASGLRFLFPSMATQAAVNHLFILTCLGHFSPPICTSSERWYDPEFTMCYILMDSGACHYGLLNVGWAGKKGHWGSDPATKSDTDEDIQAW